MGEKKNKKIYFHLKLNFRQEMEEKKIKSNIDNITQVEEHLLISKKNKTKILFILENQQYDIQAMSYLSS